MNERRICVKCGAEFEQLFGKRPRKCCYDCIPARIQQKVEGSLSTEPVTALPSGAPAHCGWCGAYNSQPYCNPQHEAKAKARAAAGFKRKPSVRFVRERSKRPIELAREAFAC